MAARGIKTKYFFKKPRRYMVAETVQISEERKKELEIVGREAALKAEKAKALVKASRVPEAERRLRTLRAQRLEKEEKARQELDEILARIRSGDLQVLGDIQNLSPSERLAAQAALNEQAVQNAQAGLPVSNEVRAKLSPLVQRQVAAIEKEQRIAGRGAVARTAAALGERAAVGTEEFLGGAAAEGGAFVLEGAGPSGATSEGGRRELASVAPRFENVLLGDGVDGIGKKKDDGKLNFFSELDGAASLSDNIVPKTKPRPIDFGMERAAESVAKNVQSEVDSLFNARFELGKTDLGSYKKGEKAFKEGRREKLVEAINDMEFEVEQQRNRWNIVEQTRARVESPSTRVSVMQESKGFSLFGSRGGQQVADMTKKINQTKQQIKQGADEAKSRSAVLRRKLQQLDAVTPPMLELPEKETKVFEKSGAENPFTEPTETAAGLLRSGSDEGAARQL